MKKTVRAKVYESQEVTREVPLIRPQLLSDHDVEMLVSELLELGIQEDCLVAAELQNFPEGAKVRKPFGSQEYLVADAGWVVSRLEVRDERVWLVADGYRISLEEGSRIFVARLSELLSDVWDAVDGELGSFRSPK